MRFIVTAAALCFAVPVIAKLPPLSDEAKAKAAETTAKSAHTAKVDGYKLCQSMDKVAVKYVADAQKAGKQVSPVATPPCADPGPFVAPGAAPPAAAAPAAPAPVAAPAKKS